MIGGHVLSLLVDDRFHFFQVLLDLLFLGSALQHDQSFQHHGQSDDRHRDENPHDLSAATYQIQHPDHSPSLYFEDGSRPTVDGLHSLFLVIQVKCSRAKATAAVLSGCSAYESTSCSYTWAAFFHFRRYS